MLKTSGDHLKYKVFMEKVTRIEAVKLGLKYYFTGKSCIHGHTGQRIVKNWKCAECAVIYQEKFHKDHPDTRKRVGRSRGKPSKYNPEKRREHRDKHPELYRARRKNYKLIKSRNMPIWADKNKITEVYKSCIEADKNTGIKHHVDHVIPLRGKLVSGLHVHYNLQVIPARDNMAKGNRLSFQ